MFSIKQDAITQAFNAAGYDDVNFDDVISAHRSDDREWEVIIDRGGQLKATITMPAGKPEERTITVLGRSAAVLSEQTKQITVMFRLNETSELGQVLEALESAS